MYVIMLTAVVTHLPLSRASVISRLVDRTLRPLKQLPTEDDGSESLSQTERVPEKQYRSVILCMCVIWIISRGSMDMCTYGGKGKENRNDKHVLLEFIP